MTTQTLRVFYHLSIQMAISCNASLHISLLHSRSHLVSCIFVQVDIHALLPDSIPERLGLDDSLSRKVWQIDIPLSRSPQGEDDALPARFGRLHLMQRRRDPVAAEDAEGVPDQQCGFWRILPPPGLLIKHLEPSATAHAEGEKAQVAVGLRHSAPGQVAEQPEQRGGCVVPGLLQCQAVRDDCVPCVWRDR